MFLMKIKNLTNKKMFLDKLKQFKSYAPFFLRIVFLLYLITAFKAEVYKPEIIEIFSNQLARLGFPSPLFFAYLGTYTVFISYMLLVLGWQVRLASIPIIIYFMVGILTYHIPEGHSISKIIPALVLMFLGFFFLLNGAGKPSVDEGF
jgi:putative oxidoreductase